VLLVWNRTDLFVDEAQYWLWAQSPDWGYYSKPPLIAWVIGGATGLAGSDSALWVRAPGPLLHGATALLLGALAARLAGGRAAVWVAAGYVTLPFTAVGSILMSTDSVMLPCLAAALLLWHRACAAGGIAEAAGAGAMLGLAFLGKYAAVYVLAGLPLAALVAEAWRARAGSWMALGAAFAVVIAPNLWWNAANDLVTLSHTADNAGWLREGISGDPLAGLRFLAEQAGVVGPLVALGFLAGGFAAAGALRGLVVLALVPLVVVTGQAVLGGAYANWALAGWAPGAVVALVWLAGRPRLAVASLVLNGAFATALPVLTLVPGWAPGGEPLMARYLGRADLSRQAIAAARAEWLAAIVSDDRDVLADLFYTGRDAGLAFHAVPPAGRPRNFYEQTRALPPETGGAVLLVARDAKGCAADPLPAPAVAGGYYAAKGLAFWKVPAACLSAP
jgi:4-amino-4-deoxy-L-arabinose transferase-like glycosyltransferase